MLLSYRHDGDSFLLKSQIGVLFMSKYTYDFLNQSYSGYLDYLFSSDDSNDCPVTMFDDSDFSIEEFYESDDYYPSEQFFYPT